MSDSLQVNNDVKNAVKYATGLDYESNANTAGGTAATIGVEKGIRAGISIFRDKKGYLTTQKGIEQILKGDSFKETTRNYRRNLDIQNIERRLKNIEIEKIQNSGLSKQQAERLINTRQSQFDQNVKQMLSDTKNLNSKDYAAKLKEYEKLIAEENKKLLELKKLNAQPTSKMGKAWKGVKKVTGYTKGKEVLADAMTKSSKLRSIAKFGRSNALTAVSFDLALAIPEIAATKQYFDTVDENGIPITDESKKQGTEKAIKQTVRTVGFTGAKVAAYAAGNALGTAAMASLWAAKGAALGSVAPGIGTAIGAVVGCLVGLGASYLAGKALEKTFGKSEIEVAQDKLAENYAKEVQGDDEQLIDLMNGVKLRAKAEPETAEKSVEVCNNLVQAWEKGEIGTNSELSAPVAEQETPAKKESAEKTEPLSSNPSKAGTDVELPIAKTSSKKKDNKQYDNILKMLDYYINTISSYSNFTPFNLMSSFMNIGNFGGNQAFSMPNMSYNNMGQIDFTI